MTIKVGDKFLAKEETYRWGVNRFKEVSILAETSRSWVVGTSLEHKWDHFKVPKNKPFSTGALYTHEMAAHQQFITNHKYKIIQAVEQTKDYETLKKIAELVGYQP